MGRPRLPANPGLERRISSTLHYQTFPTPPPKSRGQPPSVSPPSPYDRSHHDRNGSDTSHRNESPLPTRQLAILAVISLSEQTALNSISPYLPQMTSSFAEVDPSQVGFYVGIIASAFALAQFSTNFFWGWLSDRIGRKPVILTGTVLTSACFLAFGFCKTLGQAVAVQLLMGLVNGNQGVVSTCLGEITDRSNQSRAFVYLPVVYGLGGITGPILGGLLVSKGGRSPDKDPYPYLLPNLVAAAVLLVDMILTMAFLEESLEEARDLPPLGKRLGSLFAWIWQFTSSSRPSYLKKSEHQQNYHHQHHHQVPSSSRVSGHEGMDSDSDTDADSDGSSHVSLPTFLPHSTATLKRSQVFNRDTILLLATYSIFQLSNISYNSLYPIFGQASPPTGRGLTPEEIGISLAFAGAATILFQIGIFGRVRDKMGNRITYRVCLAGIVLAFMLTPWVGYKSKSKASQDWLYVELGVVLLIRSLAAVGCLTSALLLVCFSVELFYTLADQDSRALININRSQTLRPITLCLECSMVLPKRFPQPAVLSVPFYPVVCSLLPLMSSQKGKL